MTACTTTPTGGSSDLKRLYLLIIAAAQKTLDITSPYFVTDESSLWSLEDAVRRGVTLGEFSDVLREVFGEHRDPAYL